MQCRPPEFTLLPNPGLAMALSDSRKTYQVVLKVPDTVDLSVTLTLSPAGVGETQMPREAVDAHPWRCSWKALSKQV